MQREQRVGRFMFNLRVLYMGLFGRRNVAFCSRHREQRHTINQKSTQFLGIRCQQSFSHELEAQSQKPLEFPLLPLLILLPLLLRMPGLNPKRFTQALKPEPPNPSVYCKSYIYNRPVLEASLKTGACNTVLVV